MKRGRHQRPETPWVDEPGETDPLTKDQLLDAAHAALEPLNYYHSKEDAPWVRSGVVPEELTPEALAQIQDYISESVTEGGDEVEPRPISDLDESLELAFERGVDLRGRTRMWSVKIGAVNQGDNLDQAVYEMPISFLTDDFELAVAVFSTTERAVHKWDEEGHGSRVFLVEHPPDEIYLVSGVDEPVEETMQFDTGHPDD